MRYFPNKMNKELNNKGYSLIELVIAIAVLSTLAGITVPGILKTIKLNRIDEVKILMDLYASECLEQYRFGNDLSTASPNSYSKEKINTLGYKTDSGTTCEKFSIQPKAIGEKIYFPLDFRISPSSGSLVKTSTPPLDNASLNSCKLWAGDLCTTDNSKKSAWDNKFTIEKNKLSCETKFLTWKNTLPSGSFNIWDESNNSCTKKIWVHKTYIADTQSKYQDIKADEECTTAKENFSTFTGEKFIPECQKTYYLYNGIEMNSKDAMQVKLIEDEEIKCKINKENRRLTAANGKYTGETSAGSCGDSYWICNQKILSSLNQWKESTCYTPS